MNTINVVQLLGTSVLLAPEKGTRLKEAITAALGSEERVIVDFDGYQFISSTFLNHSFGQLCIELPSGVITLRNRAEIKGLSEDEADELELTLYNAQQRRTLLGHEIDPEEFYSSRIPA